MNFRYAEKKVSLTDNVHAGEQAVVQNDAGGDAFFDCLSDERLDVLGLAALQQRRNLIENFHSEPP